MRRCTTTSSSSRLAARVLKPMTSQQPTLPSPETISELTRFEMEMEFVQALSNTQYLNHLAQNLYFDDEDFIEYLRYLRYWKRPEYAQYLLFPAGLKMLDYLVDFPEARQALKDTNVCENLYKQQFFLWQNGNRHRPSSDGAVAAAKKN